MTRDDIIRMAREAGFAHSWSDAAGDALARFAALVAAAEREACIAAVKSVKTTFEAQDRVILDAVKAIRARSNT